MRLKFRIWIAVLALTALATPYRAAAEPPAESNHDLANAVVVDQVILSVMETYYDPARIDSQAMFKAAVDTLQKAVAEVKADYTSDSSKAVVDFLGKKITIDLERLTTPWRLSQAMHRVFGFLAENLPEDEYDFKDLEFAIVNGMLTVLDPHSNVLPPDIYESLRMDTAGEFGGLGIRITTDRRPPCSGNLTVVGVFDNTPAAKAGIKKGDQISRIDGDSTMNITTAEAAKRLRGRPGSIVKLELKRKGGGVKKLNVRRGTVPIESVSYKLLAGKVGYISLEQFQGNSADEVMKALAGLRAEGMKGLVLDLRGNPGGLLDIAIQIADYFLESGTIVATAGRRGKYDQSVRNASPIGTQPDYPLIVLIDGGSASAAEIIAGALGNHGRALLIGETSFGKGSVQKVEPLSGGGALKLTSAQYLTPGDISIQAVGVAPDITFVPYTPDRKETDWGGFGPGFSEADLEYHLDRPSARRSAALDRIVKATLHVPSEERATDRARYERCYVDDEDRYTFQDRYETEFARRLIANFSGEGKDELMFNAKEQVARDNMKQSDSIRKVLRRMGVAWDGDAGFKVGDEEPEVDPKLRGSAKLRGKVVPGKSFGITVSVKNNSKTNIERLFATTKSDNYLLSGLDFVFGEVKPGRERSFRTMVELPPSVTARTDKVTVTFESDEGPVPAPIEMTVDIPEVPVPRLAYSWQFEDVANRNGLVEPGEEILMHVTVRNMGPGTTTSAQADLAAKPGIDVVKGRFELGRLRPGDEVDGVFSVRVSSKFTQTKAPLELIVTDYIPARVLTSRTLFDREIEMPVSPPSPRPDSAEGTVQTPTAGTPIYESPSDKSRVIARTSKGAGFAITGVKGDFFRVSLAKERTAWIKRSDTTPGAKARPKFENALVEPPLISINGERVFATKSEKIALSGTVEHPSLVRDLMVFVGEQKVMYKPNNGAGDKTKMTFSVDVPLKEGANYLMVVARHDDKTVSAETIFVRREGTEK